PLVAVYSSPRRHRAEDHSLVLSAMGIPHFLDHVGAEHALLVPEWRAEEARRELELYRRENSLLRRVERLPARWADGLFGGAGFLLAIAAFPPLAWGQAFGRDWTAVGLADAGRILSGEGWRCVTALTLHADFAHLLANMLFGTLFATLLCQDA